jgi:transposase-like protein
MRKRLFFDLEVSPNIVFSWRSGYNLNIDPDNIIEERKIICVCWKWEGEDEVHSLTWDKKQNDKKLLKDFIKVLNSAHEIVGHNSDRFDTKWLRTRAIIQGVDMLAHYVSIDTLKKAKNGFYFNSNKLDYLGKVLLGQGKLENGGFDTWRKIVLDKDEEALERMVNYCKKDVQILEQVFHKLEPYIKPTQHYGVMFGEEKFSCPHCSSYNIRRHAMYATAAGTIKYQMRCKSCQGGTFIFNQKTYTDLLTFQIKQKNIT